MLRRCLILILLLVFSTTAVALEPILILVLRMLRDQAISTSIERGVGVMRQQPAAPQQPFGYALASPPIESGTEEQRLRALIDESFLHLSASQRDSVFSGMQKILRDPQYANSKSQIVAEFGMKARAVREGYRGLEKLTPVDKRALASQAKEAFSRLPIAERRQIMEVLQSGVLPLPRDLGALMLAELNSIVSYADHGAQP